MKIQFICEIFVNGPQLELGSVFRGHKAWVALICCVITKEVRLMEHGQDPVCQQASAVLPVRMRAAVACISLDRQRRTEEFRLRLGYPMTVLCGGTEYETDSGNVTEGDLRAVLEQASRASAHTVLDKVRAGFITIQGGHRIGLCGEAAVRQGEIHSLHRLSSLAVRVAREMEGVGGQALAYIQEQGGVCSTLILAPPGAGKTTLLRELIRRISDGDGMVSMRVGLADERGEVSAPWNGCPQFHVGRHTDTISGCSKADGMSILLRGMNPQVLATDEITATEDVDAMAWAAGCGVTLLATAHGRTMEDLYRRPLYRQIIELGLFRRVLLIENIEGKRTVRCEVLS
jgi:stage III sporulation protein AA